MASRYELRPVGVFDRQLGRVITTADAEWRDYLLNRATDPADPMPIDVPVIALDQAIDSVVSKIEEKAAEQRALVTGRSSPQEMASWPVKLEQARAYQATPLDASAPILAREAATRGVPTSEIVDRVLANGDAYSNAEATIAGVAGRHKDAVRALQTVDAVVAYDFGTGWPYDPPGPSKTLPP